MLRFILIPILLLGASQIFATTEIDSLKKAKTSDETPKTVVSSFKLNDSMVISYVQTSQLYEQGWSTLSRPLFWKKMMQLSPDSCVINIGSTREIITALRLKDWEKLTDAQKDTLRDSIRRSRNLGDNVHIFLTKGKKEFYNYTGILPDISEGVKVFQQQNVDPWYAQAILMIECPGSIKHSPAGAYGAFQLMPKVARKFGLMVNRYRDDRKNFDKSAVAASQLLATICIPEAKKILDARNISYNETDLWFRLFVLHVYNAGTYNVASVINKINPTEGGMQLIKQMWVTYAGRFRNASQNYSQVALAAMLIFNDIIQEEQKIASL